MAQFWTGFKQYSMISLRIKELHECTHEELTNYRQVTMLYQFDKMNLYPVRNTLMMDDLSTLTLRIKSIKSTNQLLLKVQSCCHKCYSCFIIPRLYKLTG